MPKIDKEMLEYLSRLSCIAVEGEEAERLAEDLKKLVAHVELLQEVDTSEAAPCNHVLAGMKNVYREDEVGETLDRKALLDNAPDSISGMFRVPEVIKSKG